MSTLDKLLAFANTLAGILIIIGIFALLAAFIFPLFSKVILTFGGTIGAVTLFGWAVYKVVAAFNNDEW